MDKKDSKQGGMSLPIIGMLIIGIGAALIVAGSCEVINFWPSPPAVAPYFGACEGFWWGLIPGMLVGLFVGYISDERHFTDQA